MEFKRGEVYIVELLADDKDKNAQIGERPIVIVSNDKNNRFCNSVDYVPLTGHLKSLHIPTHKVICNNILNKPSMALCERTKKIDKDILESCIIKKIGCLTNQEMRDIDLGLMTHYGIGTQSMSFYINMNKQHRGYALA